MFKEFINEIRKLKWEKQIYKKEINRIKIKLEIKILTFTMDSKLQGDPKREITVFQLF